MGSSEEKKKKKFVISSCSHFFFLSSLLSLLPPKIFVLASKPKNFIMGTGKKEASRRVRQGKTGDGMGNVRVKGENFYRYVCSCA